jgi:hypothetical protein
MRKLLVAAALAALAAPARLHAQPAPAIETIPGPHRTVGDDHGHGPREPRLFVSPSGEPFRGRDGLAAWFAQADTDHDGSISLAEFRADAQRVFKLYDTNGDGVIDGFEIQAYERERAPEISEILLGDDGGGRRRRKGGGGDQAPHGAGREGAARFSLLNEPEPLLAADADVDGKVTLAEWMRATERRFATLDREHTGRLTLQGLKAAGKPDKGKKPPSTEAAK